MEIRYLADAPDELHIQRHRVTEEEVEEVLNAPSERYKGRNRSIIAVGQTLAGRYLKVVYVEEADSLFVITAYPLRGKALNSYRRRRRGSGRR